MNKKLYNGNISQTLWRTANIDNSLKDYEYTYDALNRITSGIDNTGNYNLDLVQYDKNGNITNLERKGHTNVGATSFGVMDNLVYTYETNSNKLKKVLDNGNDTFGFKDVVNLTTEYVYDANGNLVKDLNKGIGTSSVIGITYNHLNLPTEIKFDNSNTKKINYTYDATGIKLKKVVNDGGVLTTTDYANGYIYENNTLQFFNHPEGYVNNDNGTFKYVYQYTDHLGNIRLSYADANNNGSIEVTSDPLTTEIIEEHNYYPFGLKQKGYNNNVNGTHHKYMFGGKELSQELGLETYDFGARNYDPALGRWMNIDPVAEIAPSLTPYRYAFNNPLSFIDPDGLYEWRVNSKTGEYERFGDKGGDEEQFIYWNSNKKASEQTVKGSTIYVGAVSAGWHKDGEITFGVSGNDLWSDLPDEYQGAYTANDLRERYEAKQEGGVKYESIRSQEGAGLARKDQVWNTKDYGRYMDNKFGSRSAFLMAVDTGMFEEMLPGSDLADVHKMITKFSKTAGKFSPKFNTKSSTASAAASVGSSQLSKNSWIKFLQVNKGKYKGKGLGKNWIRQAASDYNALKKSGKL